MTVMRVKGRPARELIISLMSDDDSFIIKPRDPAEIIRFQDSAALTEFLKDAPSAIAGALIEAFSHGPSALTGPLVRVGISALRGRALQQLAAEIKELKQKGKLADDFAERKYGFQTWVELLQIIDDDTPDEDRLEALKAMFYAANKVKAAEAEQIVGYQLFQIAKKLTSNELLILKSCHSLRGNVQFLQNTTITFVDWAKIISQELGYTLIALVEQADEVLVNSRLLTRRYNADQDGGGKVLPMNGRLTDLGLRFCNNIEGYNIAKG
jgi:hypothetical protein